MLIAFFIAIAAKVSIGDGDGVDVALVRDTPYFAMFTIILRSAPQKSHFESFSPSIRV